MEGRGEGKGRGKGEREGLAPQRDGLDSPVWGLQRTPNFWDLLHARAHVRNNNHGDQIRCEANFYTVDHECWRAMFAVINLLAFPSVQDQVQSASTNGHCRNFDVGWQHFRNRKHSAGSAECPPPRRNYFFELRNFRGPDFIKMRRHSKLVGLSKNRYSLRLWKGRSWESKKIKWPYFSWSVGGVLISRTSAVSPWVEVPLLSVTVTHRPTVTFSFCAVSKLILLNAGKMRTNRSQPHCSCNGISHCRTPPSKLRKIVDRQLAG